MNDNEKLWQSLLKDLKSIGWRDGKSYTEAELNAMFEKLYGKEDNKASFDATSAMNIFLNPPNNQLIQLVKTKKQTPSEQVNFT